jgi:hypothetical protein
MADRVKADAKVSVAVGGKDVPLADVTDDMADLMVRVVVTDWHTNALLILSAVARRVPSVL